jgi:hypothetical protein
MASIRLMIDCLCAQASQRAATAGKCDGYGADAAKRGSGNTNGGPEQSDPPPAWFLELD